MHCCEVIGETGKFMSGGGKKPKANSVVLTSQNILFRERVSPRGSHSRSRWLLCLDQFKHGAVWWRKEKGRTLGTVGLECARVQWREGICFCRQPSGGIEYFISCILTKQQTGCSPELAGRKPASVKQTRRRLSSVLSSSDDSESVWVGRAASHHASLHNSQRFRLIPLKQSPLWSPWVERTFYHPNASVLLLRWQRHRNIGHIL